MPRPLRPIADGLIYHVIDRGNNRQPVFKRQIVLTPLPFLIVPLLMLKTPESGYFAFGISVIS